MKTLKQREKMKNTRKSTLAEIDGLWQNITSGLHQDYIRITSGSAGFDGRMRAASVPISDPLYLVGSTS